MRKLSLESDLPKAHDSVTSESSSLNILPCQTSTLPLLPATLGFLSSLIYYSADGNPERIQDSQPVSQPLSLCSYHL